MADSFRDVYLPEDIKGMPCRSMPRFSTKIDLMKSGDEARNRNWNNPLRKFQLPEAVADQTTLNAALKHWMVVAGPFYTFPFRDPFDFASCDLDEPNTEPGWTGLDQALGTGDGLTYQFQLTKAYEIGGFTQTRKIFLPILDDIEILMNGVAPGSIAGGLGGPYSITSISRPGGIVTISPVPHAGIALTWGGLWDTEVRWEGDDAFDQIAHSMDTNGAAEIDLVEVRRC
jgi:uncharacterized protein (TIGR02217 family)